MSDQQYHIMWKHDESRQRGRSAVTFNKEQAEWVVNALEQTAPDDQLIWYEAAPAVLEGDK